MKKLPIYFWLLASVFVLRLALVFLFPPTADEAYYLLWAKHLSLSYVDHPPMISFLNYIFTKLPIDPLVASRLGGLLIAGLIAWVIYKISNSWLAALLFWLTPYALVMALVLTVEIPFILFYLATIYFGLRYLKHQNHFDVVRAGIFTGLGFATKYSMILIFPVILLTVWMASSKKLKNIQSLKDFVIYVFVAGVIFGPVLLSNFFTGGESFWFHLSRVSEWRGTEGLNQYLLEQVLYLSPILVAALGGLFYAKKKFSDAEWFLFFSALVPIVFFGGLSLKTMVWPHWPAMAYAPLLILLTQYWQKNQRPVFKWLTALMIFNGLLLGVLLGSDPGVLKHQADYKNNKQLLKRLEALKQNTIISQIYTDQHGSAGQLSYYLDTTVLMPTELMAVPDSIWGKKQFARWNQPLNVGDNVIFYIERGSENNLKTYFDWVTELDWPPVAVIESHLKNKKFYLAQGFKKNNQKL